MENGNKKLLWLMVIVNVLTLVLLIVFVVMSWDVITMEKASKQGVGQQTLPSAQQQVPQAQQQQFPAGGQLQPPVGGQAQPPASAGKCGDGVCDEIEKTRGVCPEDCK